MVLFTIICFCCLFFSIWNVIFQVTLPHTVEKLQTCASHFWFPEITSGARLTKLFGPWSKPQGDYITKWKTIYSRLYPGIMLTKKLTKCKSQLLASYVCIPGPNSETYCCPQAGAHRERVLAPWAAHLNASFINSTGKKKKTFELISNCFSHLDKLMW